MTVATDRAYTAALIKAQGIVPETTALLGRWRPGLPTAALADEALAGGLLGRSTELRTKDLVAAFARRYLVADGCIPRRRRHRQLDDHIHAAHLPDRSRRW